MRNPSVNPRLAFWMERLFARLRDWLNRIKAIAGRPTPLYGLTLGILAGASLLVGVSFFSSPGKSSAKNDGQLSAFASSETKEKVPANARQNRNAARAEKKHVAAKPASAEKKGDSKKESEREKYASQATKEMEEVQLSPAATANGGEGEEEDADTVRARGSWFHDQRAYPFQHIPEGALQEAIRQRDLMKQQQRAKFGSQFGAQGIIAFPGDALWHLMGPQPVNEAFSVNSGFPTASGRVTAIAVDPTDATGNTAYIGAAAGGVWKTTDGGTTWTALTDTQPSLSIGAITIDPNNHNTIYVGTGEENFSGDAYYGAGILKSTDGGTTWTQIGASTFAQVLGPQTGGALIGQIAVQPGNPSIVLAAVSFFVGGTVGGIYRSTDGGTTWTEDASPRGVAATQVVFESTNNAGTTATAWAAMGNPFGEAANGIYKSVDSGLTWTKQAGTGGNVLPTTNLGRITLGYAPSTAGGTATVYAAIADSSTSSSSFLGFFKTADGGANWTKLTNTPNFCSSNAGNTAGQCFYDMAVGVNPANASFVVVGGGAFTNNSTSLFKSTDGGTTWTTATAPNDFTLGSTSVRPHVDTHAFGFNASGGRLFVGNDGGMWRTDNPGTTPPLWVDLNATLATIQFYPGPSAGIGDENFGTGGTQDNDTEVFSGTLDWANVFACGDGGFTAIDPNIPTTVYTSCDSVASHVVRRSVFNGSIATGQTFAIADSGIVRTDRMQFIPPMILDENNSKTLYFGTCRLYQTQNAGANWTPLSGDLSAGNAAVTTTCPGTGSITSMDVSHQSSSILLAGTTNGKVWETTTGGALWSQIDGGLLPNRHVTAVKTKRNDATGQIAYVTFSGFGSCGGCGGTTPGHVFKTINGGATWANISGDLPDIPVNDIIVDHDSGPPAFDALYIATDVGVFSCPDPEAGTPCQNWTVVGDGLPNSPVLGLAMRRNSRILRAATHGRSMWSIQLTDVSPPAIALLSSVTPGAVNVGAATTPVNIFGLNFSANTQVFFDGASVGAVTFVDTTHLTVSVNSSFFTDGHVFAVTLTDPQGADNSSLPFTVMNPILGTPTLTNPNTNAGVPYTLHFTGSNFVNSTAVALTTFGNLVLSGGVASANGTVFDVPVPAAFLTAAMPVAGTITNPLPGGGPSPAFPFNFTINPGTIIFNPSPIALSTFLGTTSPTTNVAIINTSASSATITAQSITGTNLANFSFAAPTSGTTCNFPTSGQSGTGSVTLAANGGTCNFGITYFANPATPGNAVSNATLSVTDNASGSPQSTPIQGTPIPPAVLLLPVDFGPVAVGTTSPTMNATLSNFSPSSINVTSAFTVSGANQADFHIVPFTANGDGNPACSTTVPFVLASFASCDVTLTFTPSLPAGNETAQLNVTASVSVTTINPNLTGIGIEITSIVPSIVATGGPAFTLTVNGGGFASSAVVNVNGSARLTTFVNSTQILASIPASDIATAGSLAITVTTPVPAGTTSEPKTLIVGQAPSATNDNINFASLVRAGSTTLRTASGPFTGGFTGITLTWSSPFPDTLYTAVCTAETTPGDFLLPTITLRTTTSITVVPTDGGTAAGTLACIAIPDSDTSDIRHGRVAYSAFPATVTVNWNIAFPDTNYTVACTVETQGSTAGGFTSVISTLTASSVAVDNNGFATGTMHCIGVPDSDTSIVRHGRSTFSGTPATVGLNWNVPLADTNYAAVCSDVQLGVTSSGFALAVSTGSRTQSGLTVINEITGGTLHCLAVPAAGTSPFRITQDTTQATVNTGGVNDPAVSCASNSVARSVWFKFVAPATGRVVADTRFARYLAILSAWTGTPGSLVAVPGACASGNITTTSPAISAIGFPVTNGTTYFLMVADASGTGPGGTLTFSLDFASAAPANDDFNNAIDASPAPFTNTVNSILATTDTGTRVDPTPSCTVGAAGLVASGRGNTVWYKFTAPGNGTIIADTLTTPYNTILTAVTGAPGSFTEVACNDNATINSTAVIASQVSVPATSGTTYFFMVSSFLGDGGTTNFHLTFTPGAAAPAVTFAPTNVAFGNQKVATTSATTNVQLSNTGSATLNVTSITKTGTDPTQFAIVAPTSGTACSPLTGPFSLNAGISCNFGVQFAPTTTGAKSANISVADNASGSPQTVPLTGTGAVPVAALAPANIAFGNQTIATSSATSDVTVSNTGLVSMSITSITLTGTDPTQFTLGAPTSGTACPLGASALAAGANCKVGVKFAPTTLGAKSANVSVADDAAGSPQTVPLTGTGVSAPAPLVSLNPTSLPFGNQKVGTTSAVLSATLTNTGNANLNITAVSITGTNAADFASSATTCTGTTVLAQNGTCTLGATFTPGAQGARSAAFTITDNASGSPHSLPMSGTGTVPGVGLAPANIAFGNQVVSTASATTDVTLTNSGTATLNITSITLTGTDPTQFTLGAPTSGTACPLGASALAAGANCKVGVKFAPTTTGAKTASVSLVDDAAGSPQTVPLTGTGTAPGAALAPANIAFGSQRTGTSSATTDVTLTNGGTATLNISSITLTGTDPTQFTLGAPTTGTACPLGASALAAGANCKVGVKFAPTTIGAKSANVSVADDATGSPQTVPLTGTGTAPAVTLAPANIAFGNQRTATSSATTDVTVTNSGTAALNITSITLTGTDPTQFTLGAPTTGTACPLGASALAAGANCKVGVKFAPTTTGAKSANVSVADDATGSPQTVPLTGTGTAPAVTLAPANIAFGNQVVSTQSAVTDITITNSGTAALNITSITLTGANPGDFVVGAPTSGTACPLGASVLNAGANCKVGAKFSPTTTGARSASVSVADDATGSPQTVPLTGTGTAATVTFAPANVAFGNLLINTTTATTDVTLTNGGTATLNITSITLTGTNPTQFTLGAPTTGTACPLGASALAAGANCKVGVKFAPTSTGAKSANVSVADDAAGSPHVVPLTGTGTAPAVTLAPANIAFGNQHIATSSTTNDVTVTNSGTAALNITSITLTGTDPTQFTLGAPTTGTACPLGASALAAGANCKVGVKFAPTTTGAKSANVSVADDATGSPQTVPLTGTGTAPAVTLAPANIAFGNQAIATSSATTDVTVTNSGTAALNITSIMLTGTDPTQFTLGAPTTGTACPLGASALAAGANCKVGVKFAPTTTGAKSASVSVADDATGSPQTVPLTGTGTSPAVALAPANIAFGNQPISTTSATTDVTVTNSGTGTLNITSITLTGTDPTQFTLGAPTTGTACPLGASALNAGSNCKVGVKFAPTTTGNKSASVSVTDDATGSPQTVPLTGTGTTATITLAPSPQNFANQRKGTTSAAATVTVTNVGGASVTLAAATPVTFTGANAGDFATAAGTTCTGGAILAASGGACSIMITFTPSTAGAETATVNVAFQGATPTATDTLNGTGIFPAVIITPNPLPFGNQLVAATSAALTATLKNTGTDTLNLATANALVLGGANAGDFAVVAGTTCLNSAVIAVNGTCLINVTFTPAVAGARAATISITDDVAPAQILNLTGTGDTPASVTATAGTPQSVAINTAFATALQATVKDAGGSVLSGVLVTFTAPSSGASGIFTGTGTATATATTNVSGIATAPTFTANATSGGPYTVTATVAGVATPANFSLTNLAGPAASITATAGTPQSVVIGNAFASLKATVKDSGGNLVSGVTVTFTAPGAGASGTFTGGTATANVNTDAAGVATAPTFTANSTTGPYTVTATVAGVVAPANFLLTNLPGVPTITTLSPTSTTVGGVAFTLTVNGTNFVATSKVNFNGAAKTTTFVNGTQLTAAILATDIATAGVVNVTVTTPAPGGGTSTAATFTINNVQPVLTTLVPSSTTAGAAAFTLTVNGNAGSFVNGATVSFNGNAKTTTFVNNAQLTAAITAADVATAGNFNVVVTNPAPSVGPSAPATFTVNNPVPTLANAAVGGKTHVAGGAQFTLTLTGTNFVAGSKVNFGTNPPLTPTSQTATQLQVTVPASDVATAGPVNVTVTNPAPGGGTTTPAFVFTVDGFTVAGPANTTVKAGSQATLTITVTPTPLANGFANPVTFDVTGLPAHTSFTFSPTSVTPSTGAQTTTLTIKTTARGAVPPSPPFNLPRSPLLRYLPVMWLTALLAGIYAMLILRRTPRLRRYAAIVPLALLLVTGAALAGCSGAMVGTPAGPAQLTITATSGTMSQATPASSVVLTVQ